MSTPRMNYRGTITDANTVPHPDATLAQVLTNLSGHPVTTDQPADEGDEGLADDVANALDDESLDEQDDASGASRV